MYKYRATSGGMFTSCNYFQQILLSATQYRDLRNNQLLGVSFPSDPKSCWNLFQFFVTAIPEARGRVGHCVLRFAFYPLSGKDKGFLVCVIRGPTVILLFTQMGVFIFTHIY